MTAPATRIGLVVEGDSERRLFEDLRPWFRSRGLDIKVVQAGGRPRLIQEARQHLEVLRLRNCQRVFFLLDQDDDPCPPAVVNLLGVLRQDPDVIICVIARELEAWLLADTAAVHKATGQTVPASQTDDLDQPVYRLKQLFHRGPGHKYPTKTEMVRRLSRHFDLDRAASGNRSARRFVRKLAGVSSGS